MSLLQQAKTCQERLPEDYQGRKRKEQQEQGYQEQIKLLQKPKIIYNQCHRRWSL